MTREGGCWICTTSVCVEGEMTLSEIFQKIVGSEANVSFVAYDGSKAGPAGADIRITVKSPVAVKYLAQAPGEMGLARAYVSGHLDVDGDMFTALARMTNVQRTNLGVAERMALLGALGGPRMLWPRIPPPPQEVRIRRRSLSGRRHS